VLRHGVEYSIAKRLQLRPILYLRNRVCEPAPVPWTDRLPTAFQRLAGLGVDPDDPDDVRLDKAMVTLVTSFIAAMSCAWIAIYLALGLLRSAAIPFVYQLCVVASLVVFAHTKRVETIRTVLLVLMLALPFALQWSLGGFANGSAVFAWAGITPILAYLFGARSWASLGAFLALLAVLGVFETTLADSAPHIGAGARASLFVMNLAGPAIAAFLALLYFTTERDRTRAELAQEHRLLEAEQARSERLLLNILPPPIAEQLRGGATTIAESQPEVTVLFADIVGFTPLGEQLGAQALVDLLNQVFVVFDELAAAAGIEKIKTIGDAYMVVGGLPTPRPDHLAAVLELGIAMGTAISHVKTPHGAPLQLRIGVDTGPVVAGVIGRHKFSYDVWGDTVNTASRMQSHGVRGRIQVTERVARAAWAQFDFEPRRSVDIKGKGTMTTFLLLGARSSSPPMGYDATFDTLVGDLDEA
jgi:guanylate cyclase